MNGDLAVHVRAFDPTVAHARTAVLRFAARVMGAGCVLAAVATATAAADDNQVIFPSGGSRPATPTVSGGGAINTVTLILAVTLAAVGAWMVWRNRRSPGVARDSRLLAIEETRSLGNRQYLVVASYEGKRFLLGVCPGRIDLLSTLHEGKSTASPDPR